MMKGFKTLYQELPASLRAEVRKEFRNSLFVQNDYRFYRIMSKDYEATETEKAFLEKTISNLKKQLKNGSIIIKKANAS